MKLVLKIAAGVFLGIFAAFCVYIGIDSWESHERSKAYVEQQRLEAVALKERMKSATEHMPVLTPDELTAHCGTPLREGYDTSGRTKFMWYSGADGHKVDI